MKKFDVTINYCWESYNGYEHKSSEKFKVLARNSIFAVKKAKDKIRRGCCITGASCSFSKTDELDEFQTLID